MTIFNDEKRKKDASEELKKFPKSCGKLTELSSRSNITSVTLLTELSIQHGYIVVPEVDDEQGQGHSGQFQYFYAGPDLRKLPSNVIGLLLNASDHGGTLRRVENAMEMRRRTNPRYVMIDFGFGILQAELKGKIITFDQDQPIRNNKNSLNITPHHIMQIALLLNADIVVGLDWPILKLRIACERELEFLKKNPYNVRWAVESYHWKKKLIPHALYFQPLQGYTIDHHNIFLDEIKGVLFDGIAMPIRNMSISDLAVFLVNLYQRGITRVHLLGTSAFPVIALCAYPPSLMANVDWKNLDDTKGIK